VERWGFEDGKITLLNNTRERHRRNRHCTVLCAGIVKGTYGVRNNSISNIVRGIKERVFMVSTDGVFHEPFRVRPGVFSKRLGKFRNGVCRLMAPTARWTTEKFVSTRPGRTHKLYAAALESLKVRELSRSDAFVDTFVKAEKENRDEKPDPAPRVINPRGPRYNIMLGCYVAPLEHSIYNAINQYEGYTCIAKGLNARERARMLRSIWDSFVEPTAYILDVSRFDQHCHREALAYEHSFYKSQFRGDEFLSELLSWQLDNVGYARTYDGALKYEVKGRRCSGDMNTALGNVLLMCAMVTTYCRQLKLNYKIFDDGDDCVVVVEKGSVFNPGNLIFDFFRELGYKLKVESTHNVFEEITFCQCRPVFDGVSWVMCRDPRKALDKDLISVRPLENIKAWKDHCQSVSYCGLSLSGNLPIFWKFYKMLDVGGKVNLEFQRLRFLIKGMEPRCVEPSWEARVSFYKAWDITPDEQLLLEAYYDAITLEWHPVPTRNIKDYSVISELRS